MIKKGEFGAGSMGPKVQAAVNFVEAAACARGHRRSRRRLGGARRRRAAPRSSRADAVRVVTYNVRGFRDGRRRVAAVVRELAPDVLLLQETGSRRDLRRFAAGGGHARGRAIRGRRSAAA